MPIENDKSREFLGKLKMPTVLLVVCFCTVSEMLFSKWRGTVYLAIIPPSIHLIGEAFELRYEGNDWSALTYASGWGAVAAAAFRSLGSPLIWITSHIMGIQAGYDG